VRGRRWRRSTPPRRQHLIFPDQATLDLSNVFMALDEETERKYNEQFQALIGN
jgi:hypothetical protein